MKKKVVGIFIVVLFISTTILPLTMGIKNYEIIKVNNDFIMNVYIEEKNSVDNFLQGWVTVKSYNNYAPSGMPDFDQRQDKWQKITPGNNGNINSVVDPNDLLIPNNCIAPGNDGDLDSSRSGDDGIEYYWCGSVSSANLLWWIDSKHEKNNYPDNNNDTCNVVTSFPGVADDHASGNVQPFIVSLATGNIGTANSCTTTVNMISNGITAILNGAALNYNVKTFQNPTLFQMWTWISKNYGVILRLDIVNVGGHFVTLSSVNQQTSQIVISDSCFDISKPSANSGEHNDASIVSHDIYNIQCDGGGCSIPNYPSGQALITDAIVAVPKIFLQAYLIHDIISTDIGTHTGEKLIIYCQNESIDDIGLFYYLPDGIEYAGNATLNGVPFEPIIDGTILKWSLPTMNPGQESILEFDILASNPTLLELERSIRCWGFCPIWGSFVYDDDFGILNIIDINSPVIQNVHHSFDKENLTISCDVIDDMIVDEVKTFIKDPDQETNEYEMIKIMGDLYQIVLDISGWSDGDYTYHIWAKDLAGNEQDSLEYSFTISEELLADADGPYYGRVAVSIQFHGLAVGGSSPYLWLWNFGDSNSSNEQNPTHIYTNPNNYTVTLTVTDDNDDVSIDTTYVIIQLNNPPDKPTITGESSGKPGTEYQFKFLSTDPDGDDVEYCINWGDDSNELIIGPYLSGFEASAKHIWSEKGDYTIKVKARDVYSAESELTTLEISMPKAYFSNPMLRLLIKMLEHFLFFEKILNQYIYN